MSFAPIIALLPFHFALIFTSFYLWSTFLLGLLIDSFQFCISPFGFLFYFFSTQLFIPFNFAFIISTLFFMCHFFFFVPTSSTWTHLCFYISNFHPFNFTLSNCSFACSSPHPASCVVQVQILAICHHQVAASNSKLFYFIFHMLHLFWYFMLLFYFKLQVCIFHLLKCLFIILRFLCLIFFVCNDFFFIFCFGLLLSLFIYH
jgi:hypothetical protein